jgi:hypothetical protein
MEKDWGFGRSEKPIGNEAPGSASVVETDIREVIFRDMLDEDALATGVSEDRTEEQRSASAPPIRKEIMSEEINGD